MNQRDMNVAEAPVIAERAPKHVGRPMQRLEDPAILTGRGRYGDATSA